MNQTILINKNFEEFLNLFSNTIRILRVDECFVEIKNSSEVKEISIIIIEELDSDEYIEKLNSISNNLISEVKNNRMFLNTPSYLTYLNNIRNAIKPLLNNFDRIECNKDNYLTNKKTLFYRTNVKAQEYFTYLDCIIEGQYPELDIYNFNNLNIYTDKYYRTTISEFNQFLVTLSRIFETQLSIIKNIINNIDRKLKLPYTNANKRNLSFESNINLLLKDNGLKEVYNKLICSNSKVCYIDKKTKFKDFKDIFSNKVVEEKINWISDDAADLVYFFIRRLLGKVITAKQPYLKLANCFEIKKKAIDVNKRNVLRVTNDQLKSGIYKLRNSNDLDNISNILLNSIDN